jgi:fibronectin type 3 domain-containing protein
MKKIPKYAAIFAASIIPLHAASDLTNPLNTYSGSSQDGFSGAPPVQGTVQPVFLTGDPLADPVVPASGLESSFLASGFTAAGAFETIFFNPTSAVAPAFPGATFGGNRANDNNGRNYARTVETDYNTVDFTAFITVRRPITTLLVPPGNNATNFSRRSVFFGLGTGARNGGGANPDAGTTNASAYVELQNGFNNAARRVQSDTQANVELAFNPMNTVSDDSIRIRMQWNSVTTELTFSFDYGYVPGSPFTADQTLPAMSQTSRNFFTAQANEWAAGDRASIFFGGDRGVVFTDLVIDVTQPAAPPVPTSLAVASVGNQAVNLTWSSLAVPGTTFKVYRSTIPNDPAATAIASGLTAKFFTDDAVTNPGNAPVNGTTYYYSVTQSNTVALATESARSNEVPATPVAGAVAPDGVVARNAGDNLIAVDWNDLLAPFDTYKVYRAAAVEGPFDEIAVVVPDMIGDDSSYLDATALTGSTYFYRVTSTKGAEVSVPSATSAAATPAPVEVFIDFNADVVNSGRGVLGAGPGTVWNNDGGDSAAIDKLNDSSGVSTSLGLQGGSNFGVFPLATGLGVGGNPATLVENFDLMQDYRFTGAIIRDYTFSGLAPNRKYDLYLFGYGGDSSQNSAFDVGGIVKQNSSPVGLTSLVEGRHYLTYTFVSGADGSFLFRWGTPGSLGLVDAEPSGGSGFSGLQLVENASAVLQPLDLSANGTQSGVDLSWLEGENVTSYKIYRSANRTSDFIELGETTGNTYSDTTGTAGVTYYYAITAINGTVESFLSAVTSGQKVPLIVDADLDGLSDSDEALLGTNPNDAGDFFKAQTSTVTPNGANYDVSFAINGAPGTYVIERSTTLMGGSWTEIPSSSQNFTWNTGTVLTNPLNLSATGLTPAPGGKEFFRAKGVAPLPAP